MKFKHLDYLKEEVDLEAQNIEGTRFYKVPSGKLYPSITSVTSFYGREKFIEWRRKVGEEEANRVTRIATDRGTKFHDLVEKYMLNENVDDYNPLPATKFLFLAAKPYLDRINNIHALEKSLYSDYLGLAGRVDCIAEYEGELAIIDFKTSKKKKPEKWIQNYFIQESAYSFMYEERTNIVVPQLVTIIGVDDEPEPQVFVKNAKERNEYLLEFIKLRESFDLSD